MTDNTPYIAFVTFKCRCGKVVLKGSTYVIVDNYSMCLECAYPEPEKRNLKLIKQTVKP